MDDLALAAAFVRDAANIAVECRRTGLVVHRKASAVDIVSNADHVVEQLVLSRLRGSRPADGVVGEEYGAWPGTSGRTWYVDAIDGTYNFVAGLPEWCTAMALDDVLAAVYQPAVDEIVVGGPAYPTTCNNARIPALADRPLGEASVATYLEPDLLRDGAMFECLTAVMRHAATVRMLGSSSLELVAVACGRIGAALYVDPKPWDWLPGAALVAGAGGVAEIVTIAGHRWHVAGNRRVVDDVVAWLTR